MESRRPFSSRKLVACLLSVALASASCSTVKSAIEAPGRVVRQIVPGGEPPPLDMEALTLRLMRFADLSAFRITKTTEAFAERVGTPAAREQALVWQIDYTRALWRLAAAPQPYEGLFSSIVVVTALRRAHEEHWLAVWGEADRPVLDTLLRVEQDAWSLAADATSPGQIEEAHAIIAAWLERSAQTDPSDVNALPAFSEILASGGEGSDPFGLIDLIAIDPLSGLEPAVAEVQQSRRLGERGLYYLEHLPSLMSARAELIGLRSAQSAEMQDALADFDRVSAAAASLAATAERLPATVAAERDALLTQLSREITAQREGLLRDLEEARGPLGEILRETQGAAVAGREMSQAALAALEAGQALARALDELLASAGALRGDGGTAEGAGQPPLLARPFDIAEYAAAAESFTRTAQALTETLATLDRGLPQLQRAIDGALAQGDRAVDRAFLRALQLLAIALVGGAATVLVVRRITMRWAARERRAGTG